MGKQRNLEVEEYLRSFIVERLENTEAFVNTFGKDFARKRLTLNLSAVYTNEEMTNYSGYQSMEDHSITLCYEGENGSLLSDKDIQDNDIIKATALHEGVHSILEKLKRECRKLKIKSGSGVLETYKNEEELGRGFNEGLTNWIVEKAGIKTNSYKYLTSVVNQIELAIGQEETMAIGKGNIKDNVCKRLKMSKKECKEFLAELDYIYVLEKRVNELDYITEVLKNFGSDIPEEQFPTEEERQNEKLLRVKRFVEVMQKIKNDKEYQNYLNENGLDDSLDTSIDYYDSKTEDIIQQELIPERIMVRDIVFEKYFRKEFEEITEKEEITQEELEKYVNLRKYRTKFKSVIAQNEDFHEYMDSGALVKKFIQSQPAILERKAKSGELTIEEFIKIRQSYKKYGQEYEIKFLDEIVAKIMNSENQLGIVNLIDKLSRVGQLQDINDYLILGIEEGERVKYLYEKNGEILFVSDLSDITKVTAGEEIEAEKAIGDFTEDIGEEIVPYVNKFLELKEELQAKNPYAKITILGREIVINDNGEKTIYIMQNGEILSAEMKIQSPIKTNFAPSEKERRENLPKPTKESSFSRMILNIRRKLFRNTGESVIYNSKEETSQDIEGHKELQAEFKNRISDMSNYEEIPDIEEIEKKTMESTKEMPEEQDTKGDR